MGKKIGIIILVVLFVLSLVGNFYFYTQYSAKTKNLSDAESKLSQCNDQVKKLQDQISASKDEAETVALKDYTNKELGYKLKYPSDWKVKETNGKSQTTGNQVKYVTFTTPDGKYFLQFGLKKKADTFTLTDRTGIGAGDIGQAGTLTILGTSVKVEKLANQNKIKEYFYPQAGATTADGKYQFLANFSYNPDQVKYDTLDMTNLKSVKQVENILTSVELVK